MRLRRLLPLRLNSASFLVIAPTRSAPPRRRRRPAFTRAAVRRIIWDDTGFYDTMVNNPDSWVTPNVGALTKQGIRLNRHHVYVWCAAPSLAVLPPAG